MGSNALVSVIVPVYNTQEYLPACIDSILNQTYTNIQIILVDDGSPDRCPRICDDYAKKDKRVLVIHQKNKGVSSARNTGMDAATGEYLMFVDSDDELCEDAVENLLKDAIEYDADIVSARTKSDKGEKVDLYQQNTEYSVFGGDSSLLLSLQGESSTVAVWAKLFRSDFLKDVRFEEGKDLNEDGFFMFLCYVKNPKMVQHNIPVYIYNNRFNSCSKQKYSNKYLSMLYFADRKKELVLAHCPQYIEHVYNMEVRTKILLLDVLCGAKGKEARKVGKECVRAVKSLYKYHKPVNRHHKQLAWIVANGFYPIYKVLIRLKHH